MKKPLIGISCMYHPTNAIGELTHMGFVGQDWNYLYGDYVYSIVRAGGIPMILPHMEDEGAVKEAVERLDGLLVSGGEDVDPAGYGAKKQEYCQETIPQRDREDLLAARIAMERQIPVFGICRGCQILNVLQGGTIWQDVEIEGSFQKHSIFLEMRNLPAHEVKLAKGSRLQALLGDRCKVDSFHHQAIREPGKGVQVTAVSADGVTEGIELSGGHPFTLGVQWHPETMFDDDRQQGLFRAFVEACKG